MELFEANVVDCLEYRILALAGEIDYSVKDRLLTRIVELLDRGPTPLVIDMTGVKFCDSAGLQVAVAAKRHAAACGCLLAFCGLGDRVGKVFRVTGLDKFVAVYPTLSEAAWALTTSDQLRNEWQAHQHTGTTDASKSVITRSDAQPVQQPER